MLGITGILCIGGMIFGDRLAVVKRLFAWYWTITLIGAWGAIFLGAWDLFDVARQSVLRRRKLLQNHFSDEEFLRKFRKRAAEKERREGPLS